MWFLECFKVWKFYENGKLIQLIDEIKNGSWIIKNNETNDMFCNDSKKMWGENMKQMDEKFKIWSNAPEDPQNN